MADTNKQPSNSRPEMPGVSKSKTRITPSEADDNNQADAGPKPRSQYSKKTLDPPPGGRVPPDSGSDSASTVPMPNTTVLPSGVIEDDSRKPSKYIEQADTASNAAPTGGIGNTPADTAPGSTSRHRQSLLTAALVLAVLLLAASLYAAYAYYVAPRIAPVAYMERLAGFESGEYELGITVHNNGTNQFRVTATGEAMLLRGDSPQFTSAINFNMDDDFLALNFNFDIRYLGRTLYARTDTTGWLDFFIPGIQADTWYHWPVAAENLEEFTDASCTEADRQAVMDYWRGELPGRLELSSPRRHGWLGVERDGARVRHYSGTVTGETLNKVERDLADITSEDCLNLENGASFTDMQLEYDLYTGRGRDELVLSVMENGKEVLTIELTTGAYGREIEITAPEDSRAFEESAESGFLLESGMELGPADERLFPDAS